MGYWPIVLSWLKSNRGAALLIAGGLALRLTAILLGVPLPNSDEAWMGIAGRHIAAGHDFPAFFYGDHYMGTAEAYFAAALFKPFGSSLTTLRLPTLVIYLAFILVMYRLTDRLYGRRFALLATALLALGSDAVMHSEVFSGGGYPEIKPAGAGLILLALWLNLDEGGERRRRLGFAGWGVLAGFALWSDPLILPYVGVAGLLLLMYGRALIGSPGVLVAAGFVVGLLPSLVYNLAAPAGETTLAGIAHLSRGGPSFSFENIRGGVLLGVPLASGLCGPGHCEGWTYSLGALYPVAMAIAIVLAANGFRQATDRSERLIQAARLALLLGGAGMLIAYVRSSAAATEPWANVRYLHPLIISLPAVLWPAYRGVELWWQRRSALRWPDWLRGGTGAASLAAVLVAAVVATGILIDGLPQGPKQKALERQLSDTLNAYHIGYFYTDYWTCARIAFITKEKAICATVDDTLHRGHDRYLPYRDAVDAAARPAYVLGTGTPAEALFSQQYSGSLVAEAGGYRIFWPAARVSVPIDGPAAALG
jgi:hypothetical protein